MSDPRRPRVLFVGRGAPWTGGAGYLVRQKMFLEALTRFADVTAALFKITPEEAEAGVERMGCAAVVPLPVPKLTRESRGQRLINDALRSTPRMLRGRETQPAVDAIEALRPDGFDAVFVYRIDTASWSGLLGRPGLLLDIDDPEHARTARRIEKLAQTPDRRSRRDLRKLRRFEQRAAAWARTAFVCQAADAERFPEPRPEVAPNAVEAPDECPTYAPKPNTLLFVGNLDADLENPNVEGLLWFVDQVWPRIREQRPEAVLQIGGNASAVVRQRLEGVEGLEQLGFVDDMAATVRGAAVNLAPIRFGTGTRIKVLDALAQGGAVVSTTLGCEGLDVVDGQHVRLADGPSAFAAACVELLDDPELAAELGRQGHALIREHYRTAVHVPRLARRLEHLVTHPEQDPAAAAWPSDAAAGSPGGLRITFLSPRPDLSGGQRVTAIYAEHLRQRGHAVMILCSPPRQPKLSHKLKSLLKGRGWPARRTVGDSHYQRMDIPHRVVDHHPPLTDADVPDADVCVATWWSTSHWLMGLDAAKGAKAYFMQDYGAPRQEWDKLEPTWRFPVKLITISRWLYDRILSVNPDADLTLAPNGVELEKFEMKRREKHTPPAFGMFFRDLETKQSRLALEAFAAFIAEGGEGRLSVVGHDEIPAAYANAPWLDRVGAVSDDELVEVYQRCDAWLFTSASEGFGLPILEAMACGTPVIASPAGAAPELVPDGGGWLVDPFNPQTLTAALHEAAATDPDRWVERSARARATAERYDWTRATRVFERALLQAAGHGLQPGPEIADNESRAPGPRATAGADPAAPTDGRHQPRPESTGVR
jgi:glycosyltransferase involved in cell wall biosynthesis